MIELRFDGHWSRLSRSDRLALLEHRETEADAVVQDVRQIVADVRERGDAALRDMALRYDRVALEAFEVPRDALVQALDALDPALRRALERAAANIAAVHRAGRPVAVETSPEPGVVVGRRPDPIDRVGIYAPGGRAAYPSTVLMTAIPARVVGVREIILASPPGTTGRPGEVILAAAALADVDRVFAIGGAGAIAALAYGTPTIPRVDRIVGPGNVYVAEAKRQVNGVVGIDSPAGPSELVVIADSSADPADVAAEMLAQAEHDPCARVIALVTAGAARLRVELERQTDAAPRRDVIVAALRSRGGVVEVANVAEAVEVTNAFAPEHLLLAVGSPDDVLAQVRNAGAVFLGIGSSVVFGDYMTGANHVLPTSGTARFYSGLSALDFVRWTSYQRVDAHAARSLAPSVAALADAEGLPSHASAARRRLGRAATSERTEAHVA
jgi:histidinol dehydrogenase